MKTDQKKQVHIWYGKSILFQIFLILGVFCVFYDVGYLSPLTDKDHPGMLLTALIVMNLVELAVLIIWLIRYHRELSADAKDIWKNNYEILILAVVFAITCLSILNTWLAGDGYEYYSSLVGQRRGALENLLNLKLCTHETCFTTMWYMIGEFLLPDEAVGVHCVTILLAVLTVAAFYGILRNVFPQRDRFSVLLVTAVLAYNPLIFGIMGEFNIDFFVLCSFVWVVYFHIKKKYILMAYAGLLMCFSKENGVIIYAAYLFGWFLWQLIRTLRERKFFVREELLPFAGCVIPGPFWYLKVHTGGGFWVGSLFPGVTAVAAEQETAETVDLVPTGSNMAYMNNLNVWPAYIIHQLKEILFVNYGWVYALMFVAFLVCLILFRKKITLPQTEGSVVTSFILSMLAFFGFSLFYVTWTDYRYLSMFAALEGVVAALFLLGVIPEIKARTAAAGGLLVLTLASNFHMDILSSRFLPTDSLGNGAMVNCTFLRKEQNLAVVDEESQSYTAYGDLGVTNREYTYRQKVLEQVLQDIDYDEHTLLVMPLTAEIYRHMIFGRHPEWMPDVLYVKRNSLQICMNGVGIDYASQPDSYLALNAFCPEQADEKLDPDVYAQYDRVYYVLFPFDESYDSQIFLNDYEISEQFEVVKNHTKCVVYKIK